MPAAPLPLAGRVHRAMDDFVSASSGLRTLPTTVHVGAPEGEQVTLAVAPWYDAGLRADLVAGALACLGEEAYRSALPWLTRGGGLDTWEADLCWSAAALSAFARFGSRPPGFFVITRRGWRDVLTGETQQWRRVRPDRRSDA